MKVREKLRSSGYYRKTLRAKKVEDLQKEQEEEEEEEDG